MGTAESLLAATERTVVSLLVHRTGQRYIPPPSFLHRAKADRVSLTRVRMIARRALTEAALTEIRGERDAAVASLRTRAVELAVLAASRLLHSDLDVQRYAPIAAQAVPQ